MKKATGLSAVLGCIALLGLTVYVLACTSFSPDDSKVLYPAFDNASGRIGMAVYDREARRSDMLLVPVDPEQAMIRAGWLADGRQALVFWSQSELSGHGLKMALLRVTDRGPVKFFELPEVQNVNSSFSLGLGLLGQRVFLTSRSNQVTRLNLKTGLSDSHVIADLEGDLMLLPSPEGNRLFYVISSSTASNSVAFGWMNPETFALKPLLTATNRLGDETFFTYNNNGTAMAFVEEAEGGDRVVVVRQGKPLFVRSLETSGQRMSFGSAGFFKKEDALWATFVQPEGGETNKTVRYGFLEIPLGEAPIRQTILISNAPAKEVSGLYFQGGVSHNGKTAAVASTYLVLEKMNPKDCALFFIDLADKGRKVTRVPIPVPNQLLEKARTAK